VLDGLLAQCAGVGCGLVRVVAGEERAQKVFSLEGLREMVKDQMATREGGSE
jgi:hypothetical protein